MSRELKFRVWNGTEMIYDVTVGKFGTFYVNSGDKKDGLDPKDSASLTPFNTKYHESTPVMQFTGLKDSEGKEIYEGDILSWPERQMEAEVKFNNCKFFLKDVDSDFKEDMNLHHPFRIIGNIFENPELLND